MGLAAVSDMAVYIYLMVLRPQRLPDTPAATALTLPVILCVAWRACIGCICAIALGRWPSLRCCCATQKVASTPDISILCSHGGWVAAIKSKWWLRPHLPLQKLCNALAFNFFVYTTALTLGEDRL